MTHYSKKVAILIALLFGALAGGPTMAQHRGVRFGGGHASPVYGRYYAPPMITPYVSRPGYASGTRDRSSDGLYFVPSQVQMMGMTDIQYRATILANLYRSGAISSQQYQDTWSRIASER